MGRNTMAVIQTCQIQAIITVPQRLSFSAQLSNCNVVTCWQIKLIISHHTQPSPTLAFSERLTDKEIGLNTNGLTKQKTSHYTKLHILGMRLGLMKYLVRNWEQSDDDGTYNLATQMSRLWVNQIVMPDFFIRFVDPSNGTVIDEDARILVHLGFKIAFRLVLGKSLALLAQPQKNANDYYTYSFV